MSLDEILKKIALLNDTILHSMDENTDKAIIKNFIETGIKILEADFGFSWWKFNDKENYKLAFKTPNTPYNPFTPREKGGHYHALKTKKPVFDENVKKENYVGSDISPYMKSYIIIPMYYKDFLYGALTICYKKNHIFNEDELVLSNTLGSSAAQSITIHRSRQRFEQLKETEILLSQEQIKTEFIQNATHELRTPLAIMKGNVDLALIQGIKDGKSIKSVLRTINTEIKHLSNIIEDLAIFTIEGKITEQIIKSSSVNLTELLKNIVARLETLTKNKNMSIKLKVELGRDFSVFGDSKYLEKLFLNIIKNAINYGKENGKISVEIKRVKDNAQIKITDDGIGIKSEELPKIFERFFRTTDARELKKKGIGLGLAISEWVTKIHGGTINVDSTYGKGTTFTVELPLVNN